MAKYNDKKDVKKIKILSGVLGALLSVAIAGSVVIGVGFGKYGKDTKDWFKPGSSISQPDTPDAPDTPDTPDTPDVPEVKTSTPLEIGDRIALWEGAEGKNLYVNTNTEVWKEFYDYAASIADNDHTMVFFPFFASVGDDASVSNWATLEGKKELIATYFGTGDGSYVCIQLEDYNIIVAFCKDDNGNVDITINTDLVGEDGRIDLSKFAPDDGKDVNIEYVGFEGNLIDSYTGELEYDDDGNNITLDRLADFVSNSDFQLVYTTYEWFNRLFSTTPFVK